MSLSQDEKSRKEINGVQYLRGIAAVMVVLDHITAMAKFPKYFNRILFSNIFSAGAIGVELFFVISGFIIGYVSLTDKWNASINPKDFLIKRFIRIIPFMWICIISYAFLRVLGRGYFPWYSYLRGMFLFPIGEVQPSQIWTLRHEFLFYILFCICILNNKFNSWIIMFFWFISPLFWFSIFTSADASSYLVQLGNFTFSKVNLLFGAGFLTCLLYLKGLLKYNFSTRYEFLISIICCIPLFYGAYFTELIDSKINYYQITVATFTSLFALLVALSMKGNFTNNRLNKLGLLLGDASYSIYLTHPAIISAMFGLMSKNNAYYSDIFILLTTLIASCFIGIIIHIYIEKPIVSIFRSKILTFK